MSVLLRALACCIALAAVSAQAQAPRDVRVALVIGNSAYPGAPLLNPTRDASAVSEALKRFGFEVVEVHNASKSEMVLAIAKTSDLLNGKDGAALLYYAGHGLQLDWHNYMVPIDANPNSAADVRAQTIDIQTIIDAFRSSGNRTNILILDACRENPYSVSASAKGLAQMDAPPGTLIAFATSPGNVAEDGGAATGNGLYTEYLLEEINKPGASVEDTFKRVRLHVREQSKGRQVPWEATSLEHDFFFNSGINPTSSPDEAKRETAFLQEKADWERIAMSNTIGDYSEFLGKYPEGIISDLARARLDRLQLARVPKTTPDHQGNANFTSNYLRGDHYEFVVKDGLTGNFLRDASVDVVNGAGDLLVGRGKGWGMIVIKNGLIIRDDHGTYDPPYSELPPGEYRLGKTWKIHTMLTGFDGQRQWVDRESSIVALEKVTVPIGTVDAYRIETLVSFEDGTRMERTLWVEPEWGYATKLSWKVWRGGRIKDSVVRETIGRSRKDSND